MVDDSTVPYGTSLRDHLAGALESFDPTLRERLTRDAHAHLELVALTRAARAESEVLLASAVASARGAGCTWEQIGGILGMTRQAAQQRYRLPSGDQDAAPGDQDAAPGYHGDAPGGVSPTRLVLRPLTAFNEMMVLARAGRYGWHSVEYGPLYHVVERDDRQWDHARTSAGQAPSGEGWMPVGAGWGWWRYWTRPLDYPVLPGEPSARDLVRG